MLLGYVSDERYLAVPDCALLFENGSSVLQARSAANGAVYAELSFGSYDVVLSKSGYGAKRVRVKIDENTMYHFRLLTDDLLGYAWPKCVQSGESSEFRIHSPEAFKLSLWRYGLEKKEVTPIGWFDEHGPRATIQTTPDQDYTKFGVQWNKFGYSSPHHKQFVMAPERGGLHYFHVTGESGKFFSFPWVVSPSKPESKIVVLLSDLSWNAYNSFGGRSNYIHPDRLPSTPTLCARLELDRYTDPEHLNYKGVEYDPLSLDRPESINFVPEHVCLTDPIEGRAACHLAPTEWRLLGWLESKGYDYDVYSETQFHFGKFNLEAYKAVILGPHPEYWSDRMYRRLKYWVYEQGGRLIYLGGNGLNCEVEFLDEKTCIYRNEDARELRHPDKKFESRFHQRQESEANLLGVVYDERGIMTAAPYEVVNNQHWVFEGTEFKIGDLFGIECLHQRVPGGASGHETDKMSPNSPANTILLARGLNPDDGGAHMIVHETQSGGAVFSTGSICWISSLLVDHGVSLITSKVIDKFKSA